MTVTIQDRLGFSNITGAQGFMVFCDTVYIDFKDGTTKQYSGAKVLEAEDD